jgi:peptidoglycan hydrolase CwlO-like protein
MTRSDRTFPVGPRLLAIGVAVAALLVSVPIADAQTGPSAGDVHNAHDAFLTAQAIVSGIQSQIAAIQTDLARAVTQLDRAQSELAQIQSQIADTQQRIADAKARYERIRVRLNERAQQAFMSGGGSGLEILLGATSMGDLSDRIEFVDAVARSDATLAAQVANVRASLEFEEKNLQDLEAAQQVKVDAAQKLQDDIQAKLATENALRDQAAQAVQLALTKYQNIQQQRKQALRAAARAAAAAASTATTAPHSAVALPPGFHNPLQVCPVDAPRAFGDGFGAPRYTGGFHLHAGVDVLADYDTPIRAPFDGIAKPSYNTLGGNSEYVYAPDGSYVYNAHLKRYSANSNGPVTAGEIIGFVGDTGDAIGTPHDHFEWHPAVIPGNWPASYYGYTVIGPTNAVNPYPILYDICG